MVYLGLESGSDEVLKLMTKGFTADQIVEGGLKAKKAGIFARVAAQSAPGDMPTALKEILEAARHSAEHGSGNNKSSLAPHSE